MHDKELDEQEWLAYKTLCGRLADVLQGNTPTMTGAALAEMVSVWMAGHIDPAKYEETLVLFTDSIRKLIPTSEAMIAEGEKLVMEALDKKPN